MSDGIDDLMSLARDLGSVPLKVAPNVKTAVEVTARHVKDDWRKAANRTGLGGYAADVTYELKFTDGAIGAEIGPTIGDSGSFGLVEDANGDVKSSPQHAGRDAARKNEADFLLGLGKAISDIL